MVGALFYQILETVIIHWQYAVILLFSFALIFINGVFDGSSTIATIITTRATKISSAIVIAMFFNFLGVLSLFFISNKITDTLLALVKFKTTADNAAVILSIILFTILIFSLVAYFFEQVVSFSQTLLAVLIGVSLAFNNDLFSLDYHLLKVFVLATIVFPLFSSIFASIIVKINEFIFGGFNKQSANKLFRFKQIISSALMSFMHGFVDGQKFLFFFILLKQFKSEYIYLSSFLDSLGFVVVVSVIMSVGTALGGMLVIRKLGMDLIKVVDYEAFSADISALSTLLIAAFSGMPISVKQSKTMALIGIGFSKQAQRVNLKLILSMIKTWIISFPICIVLAFIITKLVMFVM